MWEKKETFIIHFYVIGETIKSYSFTGDTWDENPPLVESRFDVILKKKFKKSTLITCPIKKQKKI